MSTWSKISNIRNAEFIHSDLLFTNKAKNSTPICQFINILKIDSQRQSLYDTKFKFYVHLRYPQSGALF